MPEVLYIDDMFVYDDPITTCLRPMPRFYAYFIVKKNGRNAGGYSVTSLEHWWMSIPNRSVRSQRVHTRSNGRQKRECFVPRKLTLSIYKPVT